MGRVLVTGARGSVGAALCERLDGDWLATDVDTMDVRWWNDVWSVVAEFKPTLIYHLAGAKHAPEGELDPWAVANTNVLGTRNVLMAAAMVDARVVTASTCKACDPETAYGASKLLAERMTLNAGGSVARFYNVRETCGNVFEIWRGLDPAAPVPFTDCWRYFISLEQAVGLLLACAEFAPGRYTVDPGPLRHMRVVARDTYPGRRLVQVPRRRGDRGSEPRRAVSEELIPIGDGVERILSVHDPVPAEMLVAA